MKDVSLARRWGRSSSGHTQLTAIGVGAVPKGWHIRLRRTELNPGTIGRARLRSDDDQVDGSQNTDAQPVAVQGATDGREGQQDRLPAASLPW